MSVSSISFSGSLLAALLWLAPISSATADDWGTSYDKLFVEGADRVKTYQDQGAEVREVITKGGVQVRQQRKNGEVTTSTSDVLHGPVLCFWEIAVTVRAALDTCEETNRPKLAGRLDQTLEKLNKFIVANALEKTSMEQVQSAIDARTKRFRKAQDAPATGRVSCAKKGPGTVNFLNTYLADVEKKSSEEYQTGIDKFLSVPRLPAMNPCL